MKKYLLTLVLTLVATIAGYAQDATINLMDLHPASGTDKVSATTTEGITLNFVEATHSNPGAYLYNDWDSYKFTITSTKTMAVIELYGHGADNRGTEVIVKSGSGEFNHNPGDISVWKGKSTSLALNCASGSTYYVTKIKIWYEGSEYTPSTDGGEGGNVSVLETQLLGKRMVRTPATPINGKAVKMAIISAKQFKEQVEKYALWKTQQGYDVEEIYADDYNAGGSLKGDDWAQAIRKHLIETRPAFVLIMGDDYHVPAFAGTFEYKAQSGDTDYITDYFYGEFEGEDYMPEAYVGRFSAHDAEEMENQMEKTRYMSFLKESEGAWLNNSLCLVAPDANDRTIELGDKYAQEYLGKLGCSVKATGPSNASLLNSTINEGCGVVTYFGHGGVRDLNAQYYVNNADGLNNANKYPIMLALTCLTGTFDNGEWKSVYCLAEKMQRMKNAGTVCYVGATRESYADKQFLSSGTKEGQTYLGFMRSMFPINEEDALNQQSRTIGEAVAIAKFSISCYIDRYMKMAAEYHELFGDPTYQPYYTTPKTMSVVAPETAEAGRVIMVKAAPDAVVCISKDRKIAAVGLTDSEGVIYLCPDKTAEEGQYTLYCSAPNYTDYETKIQLSAYSTDESRLEPSTFDFEDYTRHRVLIEKHTGQYCPWCTSDDHYLTSYLNENDLHSQVYELRHYGYSGDNRANCLKIASIHETLAKTWEISGYPTYIIDRGNYEGTGYMNAQGYHTRAEVIKSQDLVTKFMQKPCYVSLSLDGSTYNPATRELTVVVSGKAAKNLPDLCLNLFITQNKMVGYQVNESNSYEHNGVSRDFLTSTVDGDALVMNEDSVFQMTYHYIIPEKLGAWSAKPEDLDVLAFVSSFDHYEYSNPMKPGKNDFSNSQVYNTLAACIGELPTAALAPALTKKEEGTTGVALPTTDRIQQTTIYDLAGRRVGKAARGLLIENGKKVIR